jgi:hypothetical protein
VSTITSFLCPLCVIIGDRASGSDNVRQDMFYTHTDMASHRCTFEMSYLQWQEVSCGVPRHPWRVPSVLMLPTQAGTTDSRMLCWRSHSDPFTDAPLSSRTSRTNYTTLFTPYLPSKHNRPGKNHNTQMTMGIHHPRLHMTRVKVKLRLSNKSPRRQHVNQLSPDLPIRAMNQHYRPQRHASNHRQATS